jgi:hypothetical protein
MNDLQKFFVFYRDESIMASLDPPFIFKCHAEDSDHAEEQCLNAYPEVNIVWVSQTNNVETALDDYWSKGENKLR